MPQDLVRDELRAGKLKEVPYDAGSRYRFTPQLVSRLDKPLGPTGRLLAETLGNTLPNWTKAKQPEKPHRRRP